MSEHGRYLASCCYAWKFVESTPAYHASQDRSTQPGNERSTEQEFLRQNKKLVALAELPKETRGHE